MSRKLLWLTMFCAFACLSLRGTSASAQVPLVATPADRDVLTHHNDNARRGAYLAQTILTPENVNAKSFGRLYSRDVEGFIYAQPLYVENVTMAKDGLRHNLIIVATCKNYVYAFDAESKDRGAKGGVLWRVQLPEKPDLPEQFQLCPITTWPIGITSTPVIDPSRNRVYVVARDAKDGVHYLHALKLSDGTDETPPVGITYEGARPQFPPLRFDPALHFNRAALLLLNHKIYIGFGAMCDQGDSHGWVFAYDDEKLARVGAFCTTPSVHCTGDCNVSGGVWQSGSGLAADSAGNIFLMSGNGNFDVDKNDFGESFVKLSTGNVPNDMAVSTYFAPNNWERMSRGDVDLGSGGPVLLPGNRVIGGGKQGRYYVLDSTGGPSSSSPGPPVRMTLTQNEGHDPRLDPDGFPAFTNTWHADEPKGGPCTLPNVAHEDDPFEVGFVRAIALFPGQAYPADCYGKNQYYGPNIHGGPLYWEPDGALFPDISSNNQPFGLIYGTAEKDYVKAFVYNKTTQHVDEQPRRISELRAPDGMPGASLALSANNNRDGIIWASLPRKDNTFFIQRGRFLAINAQTLKTIWEDTDDTIRFAKFCPPVIGGDKVFRAAFGKERKGGGKLLVYGLGGSNARSRSWWQRIFG